MTRTCLIAIAALALAACGKDQPVEGNQAFSDDDFTQSAIVANDVTAIDAATGDAANMAADLPPEAVLGNEAEEEGSTSATTGASEPRSRRPATARPSRPARAAVDSPAASSAPAAETATTNSED